MLDLVGNQNVGFLMTRLLSILLKSRFSTSMYIPPTGPCISGQRHQPVQRYCSYLVPSQQGKTCDEVSMSGRKQEILYTGQKKKICCDKMCHKALFFFNTWFTDFFFKILRSEEGKK